MMASDDEKQTNALAVHGMKNIEPQRTRRARRSQRTNRLLPLLSELKRKTHSEENHERDENYEKSEGVGSQDLKRKDFLNSIRKTLSFVCFVYFVVLFSSPQIG